MKNLVSMREQRKLTEEEKQNEVDKFLTRENVRSVNGKQDKIREG